MAHHRSLSTAIDAHRSPARFFRPLLPSNSLDREEPDNSLERRIAPRSVALEFRSWLGWTTSEGFVVVGARLMDISQGGVAVESVDAPSINQEVWFCLHPSETAFAVSGEVVQLDRGERDQHLIRVAFWSPCPATILRWAVEGIRPTSEPLGDDGEGTLILE